MWVHSLFFMLSGFFLVAASQPQKKPPTRGATFTTADVPPHALSEYLAQPIVSNGVFSSESESYFFLTPLEAGATAPYRYELHRLSLTQAKVDSLFRYDSKFPVQNLLFTDAEETGFIFLSFDQWTPFPTGPAHFTAFSLEKSEKRLSGEGSLTLVANENSARMFEYQKQDFWEIDIAAQQSRRVSVTIQSTETPLASTTQSLALWVFRADPTEDTRHIRLYNGTRLVESEFALKKGEKVVYHGGKIAILSQDAASHRRIIREMPKWTGKQHQIFPYWLPVEKEASQTCFSLPLHAVLQYGTSSHQLSVVQYEKGVVLGVDMVSAGESVEGVHASPDGRYYVVTLLRGKQRRLAIFSFATLKWSHVAIL